MDTLSLIFSFKPIQGLIEDINYIKEGLDPGEIHPSHQHYSKENKKVLEEMLLETTPELDLDEADILGSKPYFI